MNPQLEVVWNGAKERNGEAPSLSSPLIGSAARLCVEAGVERTGRVKPRTRQAGTCERCGYIFDPVARERLCAECFVATYRPVFS